jgi:hypothetical protein
MKNSAGSATGFSVVGDPNDENDQDVIAQGIDHAPVPDARMDVGITLQRLDVYR